MEVIRKCQNLPEDEVPQEKQQASKRREAFSSYLSSKIRTCPNLPPNEALMTIQKEISDWKLYLDTLSNYHCFAHWVLYILATKVCVETNLVSLQHDILRVTCSTTYLSALKTLSIQLFRKAMRGKYAHDSEDSNLEKMFLPNLRSFCKFIVKVVPEESILNSISSLALNAYQIITTPELQNTTLPGCFDQDAETDFLSLYADIQEKLGGFGCKESRNSSSAHFEISANSAEPPPEDYTQLPLLPSVQTLLKTSKTEVYLRKNVVDGGYESGAHYLDVQFRLLREDFLRPLREGLQDFMRHRSAYVSGEKKIPLQSPVRLYCKVQFVRVELDRDMVVYKTQLSSEDYSRVQWDKCRRLIHGSLLIFTCDQFRKSAFYATVVGGRARELKRGILTVVWEGKRPPFDSTTKYLMFESQAYYEACRYTLGILKTLKEEIEGFQLYKYIVSASSDISPPKYLLHSQQKWQIQTKNCKYLVSPLELRSWPTYLSMGFDMYQFDAYQAALTKEFCIIQGPPGTGKTFLGLKICETILRNQNSFVRNDLGGVFAEPPILVVCYTNHALDQFLEGILDIFQKNETKPNLVRVGSRCKSEKLAPFLLSRISRKKEKMPINYYRVKYEIKSAIGPLRKDKLNKIEASRALEGFYGIVNFSGLPHWGRLREFSPLLRQFCRFFNAPDLGITDMNLDTRDTNDLLQDIFQVDFLETLKKLENAKGASNLVEEEESEEEESSEQEESDEEEDLRETDQGEFETGHYEADEFYLEVIRARRKEFRYSHLFANGEYINGLKTSIEKKRAKIAELRESETLSKEKIASFVYTLEISILRMTDKKELFEKLSNYHKLKILGLPDISRQIETIRKLGPNSDSVSERLFSNMSLRERWALYFAATEEARKFMEIWLGQIDKKLIVEERKLKELKRVGDAHLLKNSAVVGMTTTGAAKNRELVCAMQPKIVFVEEAAEILEAHVVACLTKHTQHLILIGDHKQLRPNTTVYELGKNYNLEISLFERMVKNNLNCYQLVTQHRMRAEISNLVTGTIYEKLNNALSVSQYPKVKGMVHNLFFISHTQLETNEKDSFSKSNDYEAEFLCLLCLHLLLQGYETSQITILSTYLGQVSLIKKKLSLFQSCRGVRVSTVDNFQGEENDIILLSLVRSNKEGKIGFLNIDNRICVALSRAKHGMYVIGNMELLSSQSAIWEAIVAKLKDKNEIGESLPIQCQLHGTRSEISKPEDFKEFSPYGGCNRICNEILACSHKCKDVCHVQDRGHELYKCKEPCLKVCATKPVFRKAHRCPKRCFEECAPCNELVNRFLPCGHYAMNIKCHENIQDQICKELVEKKLPCGHIARKKCHQKPEDHLCMEIVQKKLPCGHIARNIKCHHKPEDHLCMEIVQKKLPCGHIARYMMCHENVEDHFCMELVKKTLPSCGHLAQDLRCFEKVEEHRCTQRVAKGFPCGHFALIECHESIEDYLCGGVVKKMLPCGHIASMKCHEEIEDPRCMEIVSRKLPCGHIARNMKCHENIDDHFCMEFVTKKLPSCGHLAQDLRCFEKVEEHRCTQRVAKGFPCGHFGLIKCHESIKNYFCCGVGEKKLPCGHVASMKCHEKTEDHLCMEIVSRKLPCGHTARSMKCHENVEEQVCMEFVTKRLPSCGHLAQYLRCFEKVEKQTCMEIVEKQRSCGHWRLVRCYENIEDYICREAVKRKLRCGHTARNMECRDDVEHHICCEVVRRRLPCGHLSSGMKCHEAIQDQVCTQYVQKKLPCGHFSTNLKCHQKIEHYLCMEIVKKKLPCGHFLTNLKCHQSKYDYFCDEAVERKLPCGHEYLTLCGWDILDSVCYSWVNKKRSCGHVKYVRCIKDVEKDVCQEIVDGALCGHRQKTEWEWDSLSNSMNQLSIAKLKN